MQSSLHLQSGASLNTRSAATSRAVWKRSPNGWLLIVDGEAVAALLRNTEEGGWLSRITRPDEEGWSSVDFIRLRDGKARLLDWWTSRPRFVGHRPAAQGALS